MSPILPCGEHSILYIWATPGASKERLGEIVLDHEQQAYLKIYTPAIAEKGLANKAIINFLGKKLGIAKSSFQIISGITDRRKRLLVQVCPNELSQKLKESTGSLF